MNMLENIKYVFQIPIGWYRRVAAFCFKSHGGTMIRINRKKDGSASISIDQDELESAVSEKIEEAASTFTVGTPTSVGSSATNEVTQSAGTLWTADGSNGANLLVFYESSSVSSVGMHYLFGALITITKDGRISRIATPMNTGIKIGA